MEEFPPALFGGIRIALAGCLLLMYLALRGQPLRLPMREFFWTGLVGILLFVCGNGLITLGEKTVESSAAAVMTATTPLWLALFETLWPWGDRLRLHGWLGLLTGFGGVLVLLAPRLSDSGARWQDAGPFLVLASSFCWAIGSFILRQRRTHAPHLASVSYQMILGGSILSLIGLFLGETELLTPDRFTPVAVYSFFHLLVVGSLIGYVAFTWLLKHVSTTIVSTYSYVNPAVAIFVGWLLNGEPIISWILSGMVIILLGVALVRSGVARPNPEERNLNQNEAEKQQTDGWCDIRPRAAVSTHRAAHDEIRPAR